MSLQDKYSILPKKTCRKDTNEIVGEYLDSVIQDMIGNYSKEYIHHLIWLEQDKEKLMETINRKMELFLILKAGILKENYDQITYHLVLTLFH